MYWLWGWRWTKLRPGMFEVRQRAWNHKGWESPWTVTAGIHGSFNKWPCHALPMKMLWYPCDILGIRLLNLSSCRAYGTWYGTCSVEEYVRIRSRWVILSELFHENPFSFHETNAVFRQNHKNPSLPGKEFHSCCITCYQWEMDVVFLLCQQIPSIESNICWIKSIVVNSLFGVVKWRCWLLTWKFRCVLLGVTWSLYLSQAAHWSLYVLQRSGAVLGP